MIVCFDLKKVIAYGSAGLLVALLIFMIVQSWIWGNDLKK